MVLHNTGLSHTRALTMDYDNQVLYWADQSLNKLERSNADGTNRETLSTSLRDPYTIDYYNGVLYWGDITLNRVLSGPANSPGSGTYIGGGISYDIYELNVIAKDRQRESE